MNSAPRLLCHLARIRTLWAGRDDGARPTTGWAAQHVDGCAACARHFAAVGVLEAQLRQQARRPAAPLPLGLEDKINRAVEAALAQPRRRRDARPGGILGGVLALGAALAIAVVAMRWEAPSREPVEGRIAQGDAPSGLAPEPGLQEVPERAWSVLAPKMAALATENPLEEELQAVQADTRSALRFLARNFLPGRTAAGATRQAEANAS